MKYCFLDLETTGFDPSKDSIIEVSLVVIENDIEIGRLDQVIIPDKSPLSDFVSQLTGIDQNEIDNNGVYFTEVKDEVQALVEGTVIVGHNIDFDINFLKGNGIDLNSVERLDTHELARILLPLETSFALEVLTQNYGFAHEDAHRAMSDVLASKDLFNMLLGKIKALPTEFLDQINGFLSHETTWYARHLFLSESGSAEAQTRSKSGISVSLNETLSPTGQRASDALKEHHNAFIRVGDTRHATNTIASITQNLEVAGQKVCLITPKLSYFDDFASLPTPGVLFDVLRCPTFLSARNNQLNDADTTFYLKCLYRHYLGYRGLWHFDLFFKERDLWNELNAESISSPVFRAVATEKAEEPILACSPAAFAELHNEACLADRVVIIDEGELCAEQWLQTPTNRFNFYPLLHSPDEALAQATQFFIARFVRDFLEPILGKTLSTFPERLLLNAQDDLKRFAEDIEHLLPEAERAQWLDWLNPADTKLVRWVVYAPESGNLMWHSWHPDDWRALKAALHTRPKLITVRHDLEANKRLFFRVFLGEIEGEVFDLRAETPALALVIPPDLVSQSSPDFNPYCVSQIAKIFKDSEGNVAANFSSLETLRSSFDALQPQITEAQFLAAEKVMGGDGKMLEKLSQHKEDKILLLFQKILRPELESYVWTDLVVQKFPFGAPDPLLQKIETTMKQSGHNFFSAWVMPRLTATLSRKVGQFPGVKTVYFLDPRENSRWGKGVLEDVFKS
jgi:DNA polymerase III epsilon subunit-like protein